MDEYAPPAYINAYNEKMNSKAEFTAALSEAMNEDFELTYWRVGFAYAVYAEALTHIGGSTDETFVYATMVDLLLTAQARAGINRGVYTQPNEMQEIAIHAISMALEAEGLRKWPADIRGYPRLKFAVDILAPWPISSRELWAERLR